MGTAINSVRTLDPETGKARELVTNSWYRDPPAAVDALLKVERFPGVSYDPACGVGNIPDRCERWGLMCMGSDIEPRGNRVWPLINFLDPVQWQSQRSSLNIENIICNPPFDLAEEFIDRALEVASFKVAMLLRLSFLEGQDRGASCWRRWPLARVHTLSWRVSMPPGDILQRNVRKAEDRLATAETLLDTPEVVEKAVEKARLDLNQARDDLDRGDIWRVATGGAVAFAWYVFEHGWRGPPQLHWLPKP